MRTQIARPNLRSKKQPGGQGCKRYKALKVARAAGVDLRLDGDDLMLAARCRRRLKSLTCCHATNPDRRTAAAESGRLVSGSGRLVGRGLVRFFDEGAGIASLSAAHRAAAPRTAASTGPETGLKSRSSGRLSRQFQASESFQDLLEIWVWHAKSSISVQEGQPRSPSPTAEFARQSEATTANVGATNTALRSRRTQNHNSRRDSSRSRDKLAPLK